MPSDDQNENQDTGWMSDVQRAIALILIGTFAASVLIATVSSIFWSGSAPLTDMSKTLQAALVNMTLIALGFFFGNTMSKMVQDAGQQKVVDKLTSNGPPPAGPVAPVPAPVVIVAWWSKLTDAERAAISSAAPNDPDAASFMAAAQTGAASIEDLADLVAKGLLTQERADVIKT